MNFTDIKYHCGTKIAISKQCMCLPDVCLGQIERLHFQGEFYNIVVLCCLLILLSMHSNHYSNDYPNHYSHGCGDSPSVVIKTRKV